MLYFIVNEKSKSGKGNSTWNDIENYLKENEIAYKYWRTEYQWHAKKIAEEISLIDDEDKRIVVVGGDGTINEVINGIMDYERIALGVIPNGSGNDFARGLGIKKDTIKNLKRVIESKSEKRIDIGMVSWEGCEKPRFFGISAGIGMDALVCKMTITSKVKKYLNKIHLGKLTYLILTIKALFSMETANGNIYYDKKKKDMNKLIFSAVMNLPAEGGGVPMAPKASPVDGKLSICSAYGISKWKTFFYLPFLVMAKHSNMKGIKVIDAKSINWHLDVPMSLHTDGEYCGEVKNVTFECIENKLRVLL